MLRTTTLSAAALLGVTLLAPAAPATAAATCQGRVATITGTGTVTGTEGDDVIVADTALTVNALGGDDLVCVTGDAYTSVYAGAGDDVVDATLATGASTVLGAGADTYLGSAAGEDVTAGEDDDSDTERDVIAVGGGFDSVSSGEGGEPNADEIRGDGEMQLFWSGVPAGSSAAHGGAGSTFQMLYNNRVARLKIDTGAGYLSTGSGPRLDLSGFTGFSVRGYGALRRVTVLGSNQDESVSLGWNTSRRVKQKVALRGGDDRLSIGVFSRRSSFSGGDGADEIVAGARSRIGLDLAREKLTVGSGRKAVRVEANSFEDARIASSVVTLRGSGRSNDLEVNACRATVRGLGGRDEITAFINTPDGARVECGNGRRTHFLGGPGNDTLVGSAGRDVLVGGPGRDSANGRQSRDTCRAEQRTSCEARR
ncbi:hypothetical protein SAMN05192575_105223 [Nocardioides alpinus]|uniref:Hemolysin-type calcium-binding repeat-containing protein n=1 Tax=Nocardioides alpinus TaxID=748909 RepID=A0A1I0ZD13_9ACTN|nr:hypothetical protein [Nocardioides alpinus]PKH40687.1 hypothetical protein CXG46_11905 [Nocardioides alpinus]SFB23272.1 hypothetical protein SAMN05192575_105223 [Nocardioides alpinus]